MFELQDMYGRRGLVSHRPVICRVVEKICGTWFATLSGRAIIVLTAMVKS